MKIKALFVAASVLVCGSLFAQEINRDANGKLVYGPYQTNKFWDNWYIGISGGANMGVDGLSAAIKDKKNIVENTRAGFGLAAEGYVGKNITPCFGVRIGYLGTTASTATTLKNVFNPFKFHMPQNAAKEQQQPPYQANGNVTNFNYVYGAALWNWSNQFAGYKEKRIVEVVPYVHAGMMWGNVKGTQLINWMNTRCAAGGLGIMVPFRVGTRVHIVPDIRTTIASDRVFYGKQLDGLIGIVSATVGVNVGLGKTNFTRVSTTLAATASALAAAEAAKNALQAERDNLANALAAANADKDALAAENARLKAAGTPVPPAPATLDINKPMAIYFEKGKAVLSAQELEHLDFYVQNVIAANKTLKFTVAGSADSATGTVAGNQALSQKRADYIFNLLTDKYGLTSDNFTVKALGGVATAADPQLDRAVLIENN